MVLQTIKLKKMIHVGRIEKNYIMKTFLMRSVKENCCWKVSEMMDLSKGKGMEQVIGPDA